jgi:transcriptional regulator with XRE-family HTH domain
MKNRFGKNIQLLRKRKKRSQEETSIALDIKRSTWSGYESGIARPGYERLTLISDYFGVSIDTLVRVDLNTLNERQMTDLENGFDVDLTGNRLRVLTTTLNEAEEENIELVNENAKAGYRTGYADPEYISVLPTFRLPFLSNQRKYRTFPISGDSMPPVNHGSYVTGEYVQNWNTIKSGHPYIVLTINDGIVFKIADNLIEEKRALLLSSTNPVYEPYEVPVSEIIEVWKFVNYISPEMPQPNLSKDQVADTLLNLQRDVSHIKNQLRKN